MKQVFRCLYFQPVLGAALALVAGPPTQAQGIAPKPLHKPVYLYAEQEPQLPGTPGLAAVQAAAQAALVVPAQALQAGLTGKVLTVATITDEGQVETVRLRLHLMPACGACDSAALQAVRRLPRLLPARQGGQAVYFSFPITLYFPGPAPKSK